MSLDLVVVDAGARYGLHPSWQAMVSLCEFHLFETDAAEVERLKRQYNWCENIHIHLTALFSENKTMKVAVHNHRALNSLYQPSSKYLERENYKTFEFTRIGEYEIEAKRLDDVFPNKEIHFLKLDAEGADLEILRGAKRVLSKSVLGVRAEVTFAPIYDGAPMFGEMNDHLLSKGFELLNFDYDGRGSPAGPFTKASRFGKLMSTDAVWTVPTSKILDGSFGDPASGVVRMASFLMLNNATDIAVDLLLKATKEHTVDLSKFAADPIFVNLRRSIAHLFKEISYIPSIQETALGNAYETIFKIPFPKLNEFYENEMLA